MSPGEAVQFDDPSAASSVESISTIERVKLGGVDQYLIIRGEDLSNPVMLFVHGGPGSPEFFLFQEENLDLEKNFVMVYWEQRGSGKSYSHDIPVNSMTLDQFVLDARDLSEILIERFQREKIYIMGHSWGSLLGLSVAYQYPELYHSYIGIGQISNQYESEHASLKWVNEKANELNDRKALGKLASLSVPELQSTNADWLNYLMVERELVNQYGGGLRRDGFDTWLDMGRMILLSREYTISDKIGFLNGNFFSMQHMWDDALRANLTEQIDSMRIPVYFFHGEYDYQTTLSVTKPFYDQLKAPKKQFYYFENSAHAPFLDEPDKFNSIMESIVPH
ncbi:MAG: alpha/beta hydrolase [Cyclobacteriaceae bacterium]